MNEKQGILNIYLSEKIQEVTFEYKSKIDRENPEKSIQQYLENNLERDIILRKTFIWPHIDDFDILLDGVSLASFASRWEVKSIIISLKFLESEFREKYTQKKPWFPYWRYSEWTW